MRSCGLAIHAKRPHRSTSTPKCPQYSSSNVWLLCKVWLNFTVGTSKLDGEDDDFAEPFPEPGNNAICRSCE
jgi:hypothetical protein